MKMMIAAVFIAVSGFFLWLELMTPRNQPSNDCNRLWIAGEVVHLPAGCLFDPPFVPSVR